MPTTYAIPDGRVAMAATLYTGNSSTQVISNAVNGVSFRPDWVWYKDRSNARDHGLFDSVRGVTNYLASNLTSAESSLSGVTAFSSDGFTLGGSTNSNNSGETYVGWQWKANGAAVTNTAGSITSQVSANTTAGFSVVTYTGNATSGATVGHGLGVAPRFIIIKSRVNAFDWIVYHASIGNTAALRLNTTAAADTDSTWFNNSGPSSTTFTLGNTGGTNNSSSNLVAYCFAAVPGYSAFGSYTGNGSTDGPFVYLGFRPRYVMIKRTDASNDWTIWDTSRSPYNVATQQLAANGSRAELTNTLLDINSNGFKVRDSLPYINASGGSYIYMAFAETAFKFSNAR